MGVSVKEFAEQGHDNDGRSMHFHFAQTAGFRYNLYLARYEDGRGAELLLADVKDAQQVYGLRPGTKMYLLLTSVGADNKESKPSKAFKLITHDRFLEK